MESKRICSQVIEDIIQGRRDGSALKSTRYFCGGLGLVPSTYVLTIVSNSSFREPVSLFRPQHQAHTHAAHTDAQAEPSGVKSKSVHNLKTQCGVGNGWLLVKHSGCKYGQLSSISRAHIKISSVHF